MSTLFDFTVETLEGNRYPLKHLQGKKTLIVNTASECGYTPQLAQMQELHEYMGHLVNVVAFPCNDFGGQEPLDASGIRQFCSTDYRVTFPIMEKVNITSEPVHPVYLWLTNKEENGVWSGKVEWNFNKFLIDENGKFVQHLPSDVGPLDEQITNWVES